MAEEVGISMKISFILLVAGVIELFVVMAWFIVYEWRHRKRNRKR